MSFPERWKADRKTERETQDLDVVSASRDASNPIKSTDNYRQRASPWEWEDEAVIYLGARDAISESQTIYLRKRAIWSPGLEMRRAMTWLHGSTPTDYYLL